MASLGPQPLQQQQQGYPPPSQTETTTPSAAEQARTQPHPVLRLRGAHAPTRRTVQWRSDVVDNEGLGRKKSKVCCIYHRPRAVDESSDDSSSSSDSSDSDSDPDANNRPGKRTSDGDGAGDKHGHECDGGHHHHHHHHHHDGRGRGEGKDKRKRQPSPNAYEKVPRYDKPAKDGPGCDEKGQGGPQGPQGA